MTPTPTKKIAEIKDEVMKFMTQTKKEWCGHIKYDPQELVHYMRTWQPSATGDKVAIITISRSWTRCPICGKERPKG